MSSIDVSQYEREEIKEYHFHVYFFQSNEKSTNSAKKLRETIQNLNNAGFFVVGPMSFLERPVGPHTIGSFGVWCPKEHFARLFSFLVLNRGDHSVLIHPLTTEEFKDHTVRGTWMGTSVPLDPSKLAQVLPFVQKERPELGLGYSAKQ